MLHLDLRGMVLLFDCKSVGEDVVMVLVELLLLLVQLLLLKLLLLLIVLLLPQLISQLLAPLILQVLALLALGTAANIVAVLVVVRLLKIFYFFEKYFRQKIGKNIKMYRF
jgi:hypothetical protein